MNKSTYIAVLVTALLVYSMDGFAQQTGAQTPKTPFWEYALTGVGNRNGNSSYHSTRVLFGGCIRRGHGRAYCGGDNAVSYGASVYGRVYREKPKTCRIVTEMIPNWATGNGRLEPFTYRDCD